MAYPPSVSDMRKVRPQGPKPFVAQPSGSRTRYVGAAGACRKGLPGEMCSGLTALRADNFESLKPAAFVFGNINIAFGIDGSTDRVKELAREEKPSAVTERRHDLSCCAIQDVDFPLVLIGDIYEPLIWIARELHRDRRSPPADLLHQAARRKSPPQRMAIPAKVFVFRSVVLPRNINVPFEGSHLVENLQPVCHPVACIYQAVIRQSHAMRQFLDVLFRLAVVQPPLAQKRSIPVQHRNSVVSSAMAVGDVNIPVLRINIDSG